MCVGGGSREAVGRGRDSGVAGGGQMELVGWINHSDLRHVVLLESLFQFFPPSSQKSLDAPPPISEGHVFVIQEALNVLCHPGYQSNIC